MSSTRQPDLPFPEFVPQRRFGPFALSPDGSMLAYITNDGGQYNLWTLPLDGGSAQQITSYVDHAVRSVAWSPDGRRLVFTADHGGDEQTQVYLVDSQGGDPRRVTTADGRQHVLADDPFTADGRILIYGGNDRDEAVQDVVLHDLATGEIIRFESVPGELFAPIGVSRDGRWLLLCVAQSNTDSDCAVIDLHAATPTVSVLTAHQGEANHLPVAWLPDSSGFTFLTTAGREFVALARFDLDTGAVSIVAAPSWDVEAAAATDSAEVRLAVVNSSGTSQLHVTMGDPSASGAGTTSVVPAPNGVLASATLTAEGSRVLGLFGSGGRPKDLVSIEVTTGVVSYLTDSRPPALARRVPVEPELVEFATHDGRMIPAWLYRPAADAGMIATGQDGRSPVVLSIHGGPEAQERAEYAYSGLYQFLLSQGVGVLAPNVRGSTGYGTTYQSLIHRDWGGAELADFDHSVRYLSSLDWVDADRVGVFGGSFGGFAALSCLARLPELFAAGVSIVGPSNLVTLVKAVPPTWRALMTNWLGDPEADFDFLMSRSPITFADRITAPLMVVQGANDPRVVRAESDQIVEALRSRGVEVRYDVYDDEGHGFTKRSNEIRALGDVADFLIAHLCLPG